jgi:hypothetical protein
VAGRAKKWIWVVIAVIVACLGGVVAIAGVGFYFFKEHVVTHTASPAAASREFDQARAPFAGQKPLIELDRHGTYVRSNPDRPASATRLRPDALVVLAFDPEDGRIVRLTIPFWMLRLKTGGGSISFNGKRMDLEDLKLSVADLERYGSTLIVDHVSTEGNRVLVWSQ